MLQKDIKTDWYNMSDPAIIREIGKRIKRARLNKNITQMYLAELTGLDRATISQMENGKSSNLMTVVQILRALGKLNYLDAMQEEYEVSPLQAVKLEGKRRRRASSRSNTEVERESEW